MARSAKVLHCAHDARGWPGVLAAAPAGIPPSPISTISQSTSDRRRTVSEPATVNRGTTNPLRRAELLTRTESAYRAPDGAHNAPVIPRCRCGAHAPSITPTARHWRPERHKDPGSSALCAVVIYGRHPHLSCAQRVEGDEWLEFGQLRSVPWRRVGMCWADVEHPVIALRRTPLGLWVPRANPMLSVRSPRPRALPTGARHVP